MCLEYEKLLPVSSNELFTPHERRRGYAASDQLCVVHQVMLCLCGWERCVIKYQMYNSHNATYKAFIQITIP